MYRKLNRFLGMATNNEKNAELIGTRQVLSTSMERECNKPALCASDVV